MHTQRNLYISLTAIIYNLTLTKKYLILPLSSQEYKHLKTVEVHWIGRSEISLRPAKIILVLTTVLYTQLNVLRVPEEGKKKMVEAKGQADPNLPRMGHCACTVGRGCRMHKPKGLTRLVQDSGSTLIFAGRRGSKSFDGRVWQTGRLLRTLDMFYRPYKRK